MMQYQPLVAFSLTPKYMTLNDYFTFNFQFSLLRTVFQLQVTYLSQSYLQNIFVVGYDVTIIDARKQIVKKVIRRILRLRERIVDLSQTKSCGWLHPLIELQKNKCEGPLYTQVFRNSIGPIGYWLHRGNLNKLGQHQYLVLLSPWSPFHRLQNT